MIARNSKANVDHTAMVRGLIVKDLILPDILLGLTYVIGSRRRRILRKSHEPVRGGSPIKS